MTDEPRFFDLGESDELRRRLMRGARDDLDPKDGWCARCGPDAQPAMLSLDGSDLDCDRFCARCHPMIHWREFVEPDGENAG